MRRFIRDQSGMIVAEAFVIVMFFLGAGTGLYWFVFVFSTESELAQTMVSRWKSLRSVVTGEAVETAANLFESTQE